MIIVYTLLVGLAAYRLWRLLGVDSITEPLRARLPERLLELVACHWCLGTWAAFGLTWATDVIVGLPVPVLVGLGSAVVVGWLGDRL